MIVTSRATLVPDADASGGEKIKESIMTVDEELKDALEQYNHYMGDTMGVTEIDPEYYLLTINGQEITTGDIVDMLDRVKQINRENGLTYL